MALDRGLPAMGGAKCERLPITYYLALQGTLGCGGSANDTW